MLHVRDAFRKMRHFLDDAWPLRRRIDLAHVRGGGLWHYAGRRRQLGLHAIIKKNLFSGEAWFVARIFRSPDLIHLFSRACQPGSRAARSSIEPLKSANRTVACFRSPSSADFAK